MKKRATKLLFMMAGIVIYLATTADSCGTGTNGCSKCGDNSTTYGYIEYGLSCGQFNGCDQPCNSYYQLLYYDAMARSNGWRVSGNIKDNSCFCIDYGANQVVVTPKTSLFYIKRPDNANSDNYTCILTLSGCNANPNGRILKAAKTGGLMTDWYNNSQNNPVYIDELTL